MGIVKIFQILIPTFCLIGSIWFMGLYVFLIHSLVIYELMGSVVIRIGTVVVWAEQGVNFCSFKLL